MYCTYFSLNVFTSEYLGSKMATKVSFNTNDEIIKLSDDIIEVGVDDPVIYFEINRCIEFIESNNYQRVALQLPDELMAFAQLVSNMIEKKINRKVYVLADTSYGSCCVDEVAAQHINADALIHFGHSCLSNTEHLPVLYVFGRAVINNTDFLEKLKEMFADKSEHILLFYDVSFYNALKNVLPEIQKMYCNTCFTEIDQVDQYISGNNNINEQSSTALSGRKFTISCDLSCYKILFVGCECITLRNLILTLNKNQFFTYDPSTLTMRRETLNVNKSLMRRYYLIEKAKDSQIIGIVMGTLGVKRYKEMVDRLKAVLKHAGKKFYTFVVGKVNVAKMANFMEIDIFVLIACPENSLIDSKEFYKPIVTPYEMEIACLNTRQWTGNYSTDFRDLLPGSSAYLDIDSDGDDTEPEFSFITGKLRTNLKINEMDSMTSTDVMSHNHETQLTTQKSMSAIDYLSSRSWQGLQVESGKTEVTKAEDGRSGIAMSYTHEPST